MLVVENMLRLDIADLKELPAWPQFKMSGRATVHLQAGSNEGACVLALLQDETPFGTRMWFACPTPSCGRRCKHLYLVDGRLACRECLGAWYLREAWPGSRWRDEVGRPALKAWRKTRQAA